MNANQNHLVLAPLFIYGEKRKFSLYQAPSFNYGVNPKSKIRSSKISALCALTFHTSDFTLLTSFQHSGFSQAPILTQLLEPSSQCSFFHIGALCLRVSIAYLQAANAGIFVFLPLLKKASPASHSDP